MSTDPKKNRRGRWALPLLIALPFLAVIALAVMKFGPDLLRIINVLIKAAVVS